MPELPEVESARAVIERNGLRRLIADVDDSDTYVCRSHAPGRAHARTGRATVISGYLGSGEDFDHAIADFAIAYADRNEQDHRRLLQAVSAGRVQAAVERP